MKKEELSKLSAAELEERKNKMKKLLAELEEEEKKRSVRENTPDNDKAAQTEEPVHEKGTDLQKKERSRTSQNREERQKRRERGVRRMKILLVLAALFFIAGGVFLLYRRYRPSSKRLEAKEYYELLMNRTLAEETAAQAEAEGTQVQQSQILTLGEDELAVVMENRVDTRKAIVSEGSLYIDYSLVREELNDRFFWDDENTCMLYTTDLELYRIPVNTSGYSIDGEDTEYKEKILIQDDGGLFVSASFLQEYTNMDFSFEPGENHALIHYIWGEQEEAFLKKDEKLRLDNSYKSPIVRDLTAGEKVVVLEEADKWEKAVTQDGYIGYIPKRKLTSSETVTTERAFQEQTYSDLCRDKVIHLLWQMVDSDEENDNLKYVIKQAKGVNVISPTWFQITSNDGDFVSYASSSYVKKAHKAGMEVWGLVSNIRSGFSSTTLLASTKARNNLENKLIEEALACGLDGINVDMEAISQEAGYSYVQLMREMSILCRKNNLVLSVDLPVPMSFNRHYDREELGKIVDYVIIMGYDEHYVGSDPGSVASLPFEENGIIGTLEDVPARKIISGVPFYNRLWFSQENGDGTTSVWSETHDMDVISRTIESYQVETVWDSELGQTYAGWVLDNGIKCEIWVEDEESLALKAALVKTYELGGIAEWVFGFQRNTVWEVICDQIGLEIEDLPEEVETEDLTEAQTENLTEEAEEKNASSGKKGDETGNNTKTDSKAETESNGKTDSKAEAESNVKAGSKAETESDVKTDSKAEKENSTETGPEAETKSHEETGSETETDIPEGKSGKKV